MSSLSNLKMGADVNTEDKDSLGGGYILDSGVYDFNIDLAYMGKSQGGAVNLNLVCTSADKTLRQTLYVTSGDAKGNKTTYTDKDGNARPLPGMSQANAICQLTLNLDLGDMDTEEKVIKLYDYTAKADIDTKVAMIMPLIGQKISFGVQKVTVDKNVKNDQGVYVPSGDTRQENEIDKIFQATTHLTMSERAAGLPAGEFVTKWADKWNDQVRDKSSGAKKGGSVAGAPPAAASATAPLFPSAS